MSVSGLCQICSTNPATERCESCGTLACENHFERRLAVCIECARDREGGEGIERSPNEHPDVDTSRF